jgi:hypothetical protein
VDAIGEWMGAADGGGKEQCFGKWGWRAGGDKWDRQKGGRLGYMWMTSECLSVLWPSKVITERFMAREVIRLRSIGVAGNGLPNSSVLSAGISSLRISDTEMQNDPVRSCET